MNRKRTNRSGKLTALALMVLAVLLLAACGSSSKTTSTSTTAASATAQAGTPGAPPNGKGFASRFKALRECLQKEGITLPERKPGTPGKRPNGAGGFFGGGQRTLPKGVTRAKYEAALKKCGGGRFAAPGALGRLRSPTYTKALAKFAECMRSAGVNVPAPNTSGNGPIFNTKGLDTTSAKFKAADAKCASLLRFARPGGAPGTAAAPPGAGTAPAPPSGTAQ